MKPASKTIEQIAPRLYQSDQKLHQLLSKLELLQYINPINSEKERLKFYRSRYYYEPDFRYPKCQHNLLKIRKHLNRIKVHKIEHPIARHLYEQTIWYFNGILDCISTVGQGRLFLNSSLKTFGAPSHSELQFAHRILEKTSPDQASDQLIFSTNDAVKYMKEYNKNYGFDVAVEGVTHITSKAMVSNRLPAVFLRKNQKFSENELVALANHEIGVHLVTTFNAKNQPLKIYEFGTPFNVESQEGLAVLSEYYSGSLTLTRLRELALRVILANRVVKDYSFSSSFNLLLTTYGLDRDTAFKMVTRLYRGGGFTKDRLYLSGLYQLLTYGNDLPLDWLLAGKTSLAYVDLIQEIGDDIPIIKPLKYQSFSFNQNLGLGTEVDRILKSCIQEIRV